MRTRKTEAAEAQETADLATTNMLEGRGFTTPGPVEGDGNVPRVDDALLHIFDDPVQEVESRGQSCRDSSNIQRDTPGPHVQMERDGSPSDSVPPGNKRKAHTQASSRHRRVHDGQREEDCAPTFEAQTQDDFESDAQLAARLAAEERRTSARSLRSRSEVDERSHNLPTPSPVKRTSSRKNGDDRRKQRHRSPSKEATETPTRHAPDVSNRTRNVKGRFLSERAQSRRAHKRKRREPSPEPDSDVAAVDSDDEAADVAGALMATSAAPSPREPTSPPAAQANGDSSGAPTVTADSCSASAHTPPPVLAPLTPSPEQASRSPLSGAEPDTWDDAADPAPLRKPGGKMSLPPEHVNGTHESGKRRAVSAAAAGLTALSANGSAGTHTRGSRENEEDAEGESDDDL
ncbi:hypothetical protein BD626DRAFT_547412 [Schizophyllum amplum]|uniref:Uncharacterized protein n=1 Tax=Schizophyllum amplum TaxID=97359 RepID=A0A550CHH4_9AGAR|nr:hypothetical protein BD626DRAFT_547412 [Auriculariopsis ampla]